MCWPLMKKFLTLSVKNVLMLKGLLAVASATDSVFQKIWKIQWKILKNPFCWWRVSVKQLKIKQKKQKGRLLSMLLGTLADGLFGIMLVGEAKILGQRVIIVKHWTNSKRN